MDLSNLMYQTLPGKDLGLPEDALGPTKKVFIHNGQYSTHLNARDDKKIFPLLVPNQVGLDALLYGAHPTKEQYDRAEQSAQRDPKSTIPLPHGMRGDSSEADAFEKKWHDEEEKKKSVLLEAIDMIRRGGRQR